MAHQDTAVKLLQAMLQAEIGKHDITPSLIAEKLDWLLRHGPQFAIEPEQINRQATIDEMVRRFSLWIGHDTMLTSDTGHEAWLVSARKQGWRYWPRYREWLDAKLPATVIDAMDRSTDRVLGLLEDPLRPGAWDRRGLVVGNVQSGKTGHYIGLVSKAADAGYKIVIVLAGLHNNLRSQTQMRLDEGFLGYETTPREEDIRRIGVGTVDPDPSIQPNFATNRTDRGDFTTRVARNLGISPEQKPWLFVVKKNRTVLNRLLQWIRNHVADLHDRETERRVVTKLPLLMIDDEADHASVDTREQVVDEDGRPDEDHQPTAINSLVRRVLHSFARSAYVGYTATPFANIFIHERGSTNNEGPDLFPAAFIANLATPSDYVGSARIFGGRDENADTLDLVRTIDDYSGANGGGWMPLRHKNGHAPRYQREDRLPPSLEEAIDAFVLACAARRARGQTGQHSSMLIHVTRYTSVQNEVHRQVESRVRLLRQRLTRGIGVEQTIASLKSLWERDFESITRRAAELDAGSVPAGGNRWGAVEPLLPDVVSDVVVKTINGTAKDALDYTEHQNTGLTVIAIGGDKLSRGLTLEGLCVSYFLRASRMYDTLMQMGRWFGYRPGYVDLCRLYTTADLAEWFGHITDAASELREEFEQMADRGGTPREYGLKVQSHPVLMVTSRLKMRTARSLMLSFSGTLGETVALYRTVPELERNLTATRDMVALLGDPEVDPERQRRAQSARWKGFLWNDVPALHVLEYLSEYRTHPIAYRVNSTLLSEFIGKMLRHGELTRWTVVLIGGGTGRDVDLRDDITVAMLKRTVKGDHLDNRYSIGRLMSPRDEAIDLDDAEWNAALRRSIDRADRERKPQPRAPSGPDIRHVRGFGAPGVPGRPDRGLLFLYMIDPRLAEAGFADDTPAVAAFAISFPSSNRAERVEYKVNNVMWEQWEREYGAAD
ncbi:MAG: Z1 domain-containing protein [Gammaproteobacteria bacterium]|nr:Z1 domain-containing protein [Gammaproteobacteria bacterium]